jgi:hypothetical protein
MGIVRNAARPTGKNNIVLAIHARSIGELRPVGSIPPVGMFQRLCQPISRARNGNQVDMIGHEAIANQRDFVEATYAITIRVLRCQMKMSRAVHNGPGVVHRYGCMASDEGRSRK